MKKYLLILTVLLFPFCNMLNAQDADGKRMTTAERKDKIKTLVETKENGDVIVNQNPDANYKLKSKAPRVPGYLMDLMLHIDPNLDFEKFNKFMVKYTDEEGKRFVNDVLKACDEYLATNNMRLKPVKFQPNNIKNRIDSGLPYFMILYTSDAYGQINNRCTGRPEGKTDWKEWQKTIRKEAFKDKPKKSGGGTVTYALLRGYNKQTDEYFVQVDGKNIWMTDGEIKLLQYGIYEPRI